MYTLQKEISIINLIFAEFLAFECIIYTYFVVELRKSDRLSRQIITRDQFLLL